jgi:GT2 family glycosyltransferase
VVSSATNTGPEAVPQTPRISVVIVSLNRHEALRRSLQLLAPSAHQVVVVDNGSRDGSAELAGEFPQVRFSKLPKNFGLTKALNIGLRAAQGDYLLCLHDDVRITPDAVTALADYLEAHPEAGAVCPLLVNEDDLPAPQLRALPTPSEPEPVLQPSAAGTPECVLGAAIMFRSFFLQALRQIDERYGTYGSDVEICMQVRRAGKKLVVIPEGAAVHLALRSPVYTNQLEADRVSGIAEFIGKHHGFMAGLLYRVKATLLALFTFRFAALMGAVGAQKIDGTS